MLVLVLLLALVLILTLELEQELELVMLLVLNAVAKLGMAAQAAYPARLDRRRLAPWLVCCPWLCVAHSDAVPALLARLCAPYRPVLHAAVAAAVMNLPPGRLTYVAVGWSCGGCGGCGACSLTRHGVRVCSSSAASSRS